MGSDFRITLPDAERLKELEELAPAEVREHFELIRAGLSAIPGIPDDAFYHAVTLRALALNPEIFYSVMLTEHHSMKRGEIPNRVKELVAFAISQKNEETSNEACAPYHAGAARFEGATQEAIRSVGREPEPNEGMEDDLRIPVEFGLKAAFQPKDVNDDDIKQLRELGYSDAALVELVVTAMVTYTLTSINRIFNLREGEIGP